MISPLHPNRGKCRALPLLAALAASLVCSAVTLAQEDELTDILNGATTTTAPSGDLNPDAQKTDPLGTRQERVPAGARVGVITFNQGKAVEGRIWTTLETPIRVWIEELKMYRDVDWSLIKRVDVVVVSEAMEDDWRWKKEGSDEKVYSGKKYPNVELLYRFTLLNGQVIEGGAVAPIYFADGLKARQFALYKKYKGKLDETLKDLVYIKTIVLQESPAAARANDGKTAHLPLIAD
jgi:hypothetical protein